MVLQIVFLVFASIPIIATLASLLRFDQWWIRVFDFPRVQIVFLAVVALLGLALTFAYDAYWHVGAIILLSFCLLYQGIRIFPYTPLASKQVIRFKGKNSDDSCSIMVSNVLTTNRKYHKLLKVVKQMKPDILLTLETDKKWEEALSELEEEYPYTVKIPLDNLYGMHLYSKLELIDAEVRHLVEEEIPSIRTWMKLPSGKKVRLYCLHPTPPSPTERDTSTNRDAELLLVGKEIEGQDQTAIVIGDLNDVAWSRTTKLFQKISGLMDPRIGRGFFNTFHASIPVLRWPLDHVFHSDDFTLVKIQRLPHIGSDHFPIYTELHYEPRAEGLQEELEAEKDEEEWAEEKIEKAEPINKVSATSYSS
ncbi:endonuclease/exonuclease/phosphatase family protein [Porifericola rhodea]|uniref:endonuclease/exonuclease/phosphatase family protein n=1 Tax=Porifericola rhodea TaxID=930972 RepID=UPI00266690B2|nr:endonuclease/exonuclease/phosphatase family protein [Porifericola rhodea]WKN31427.1 endonuclease/exonuclease/phosphatase family protein [Porifericola rhodea]